MGRRPADFNPALIEPDHELVQEPKKKPRLTQSESTAMAALLSFRLDESHNGTVKVEANTKIHTQALKPQNHRQHESAYASSVTDDEESICSRQSQASLPFRKRAIVMAGSPPPLNKALIKPTLPSFKLSRPVLPKIPQGRPLAAPPGLAKHLVKQTKPICLKLSP